MQEKKVISVQIDVEILSGYLEKMPDPWNTRDVIGFTCGPSLELWPLLSQLL